MTIAAPSAGEKVKLRGEGQYSEVFVIPRVPNVIYSARLNGVPTSTDMVGQINFDGGSGTLSNIRLDMSVKVGTTSGSDDLGNCRIRKATLDSGGGTGIFYIGELSHIDWQADCYLTVIDDFDVMPRHIKIIAGVPYIDYEIAYSDQHSVFDPTVCMGGHRVLILPTGGTINHQRSTAGSFVWDGSISSRLWEAPGASAISGDTTATATITYDTVGHYVEYCTLTSDGGKTFFGARYVFVVDEESLPSIHSFRLRDEISGGVSFETSMSEDAEVSDFTHRAFVIAFSIDYFQGVKESIGYVAYEKNILSYGRIEGESITFDIEKGTFFFRASNYKRWLSLIAGFPFGIEQVNSTTLSWTSMTTLTVDRAIWHLLHFRTTITRICDFYPSGNTLYAKELASVNSNIAAQIEEIATTSIFADLVFDRFCSCRLKIEPQVIPEADRSSWVVVQELTADDWQGEINTGLETYENISQVNSSGVSVEQYGGDGTPHFSLSYGRIPAPYGSLMPQDRLLLEDQSQSNSLAGLLMGWNNRLFDSLPLTFVGNYRFLTLAEYSRFEFDIGTNPRGIVFDGYILPRSYSMNWEATSGIITVSAEFQDESVEQISVTGDFPSDSGMEDIDFSAPPLPAISIPPIAFVPMPLALTNANHPKQVIIGSNSATAPGIFYTLDFDASTPTWFAMNSGITADLDDIRIIEVTPNGTIYALFMDSLGNDKLYRATALGASWSLIYTTPDGTYDKINGLGVDKTSADRVAFTILDTASQTGKLAVSTNGTVALPGGTFSVNAGAGQEQGIVFINGKWYVFGSATGIFAVCIGYIFSASGAPAFMSTEIAGGASFASRYANSLGGSIFHYNNGGAGYFIANLSNLQGTSNFGFTPSSTSHQGWAFSPTGTHGMGAESGFNTAYKTTDGAASMQSAGGVIPAGSDVWENCGDDSRWIFGGGIIVRLTVDHGASYVEKAGNLAVIAPLIDVCAIRFVSDG